MNAFPPVGVVILNYNGYDDTKQCVASLLLSDYAPFRVYIVDNCSDNTEGLRLKEILSSDTVRVVMNGRNVGFGAACNQGMRMALADGAEFLLLLNNDTLIDPNVISKLVNAMQSDVRIGASGPRILDMEPPHKVQCLGYQYSAWVGIPRIIGKGKAQNYTSDSKRLSWLMGCALMLTRDVVCDTGGFDKDFFLYWEDVYLCWLIRNRNKRIALINDAVVYHRKTVGSEYSRRHVYHMTYGQWRFAMKTAKWYQWPTLVLGLLIVACGYSVLAAFRCRINVVPQVLGGALDAIRCSPKRTAAF